MSTMKTRLAAMACALFLSCAATASPVPDYPFVHVVGSAYTAVPPDIAALDFEIVAVDADPAAARTVLETRIGEIRALMQTLDMDPEDAVVREVRQNLVKGEGAAGAAPGYELRCDVKIKLRNVSNWAALAGGLFGKPNLDGFASSFDLSTMEQTKDELVISAIGDARRRADVIATASGRRLGAVTAVTPDAIKNLSTAMGLQREEYRIERRAGTAKPSATREQLLMIPALQLNQPVDVIFRLENVVAARQRASRKP